MNIVFDLGGVVVTWLPEKIASRAFKDPRKQALGLEGIIRHPDWLALDRGTLSRGDAIRRAARRTGLTETEAAHFLDQLPPSLEPMPDTVALMRHLKDQGHSLYCLSNMHHASIDFMEAEYDFFGLFSGTVISCRVQMIKPDPAIYAYLLERHGLAPAQTVFIDDVEENLVAARAFGIQVVRFQDAVQCAADLQTMQE